MHIFFATNNLGGGGTNVSRFIIHLKSLNTKNIGILLNYYYLNNDFKKTMSFDQDVLRNILTHSDIREFLSYVKDTFISKGRISDSSKIKNVDNIASYILDSGSGNILRDLIKDEELNDTSISKLILLYHNFAEKLNFDFVVALDYALKYTHKQGENESDNYQNLASELTNNEKENLKLLKTTLQTIGTKNFKHKILAPLHGFNFESFKKYQYDILKLENQNNSQFNGFALGGIADTKKLKNELWNVPAKLKLDEKNIWIVSKLTKQTYELSKERFLHVLGAGNIKAIPFLNRYGATSSDCHSAWRRANDGDQKGENISKILVPLFDDKLQFIDNKDVFEYVTLDKISNYKFPDCNDFSIKEIAKLYNSANKEDFYYAKILIFIHALYQYDRLINFMKTNTKNYIELLSKSPDKKLNNLYLKILDLI